MLTDFEFEVKELGDDGTFEGLAAVFGNVDQQGDRIEKGAFKKTIRESKGIVPILWQHDPWHPIGVSESMEETDKGLAVVGQLVMDVQQAREAHALMKAGAIKALSIGYRAVKETVLSGTQSVSEAGAWRLLHEVKLREFSPVTFPANEAALITHVKRAAEIADALEEVKAGRVISAANRKLLNDALAAFTGGAEAISALLAASEPLEESTPTGKGAADPTVGSSSEPAWATPASVKDILLEVQSR